MVSIITPVFNSAKYIRETLVSVLSQSYKDWEMIMVDDCSTDNSILIIKEFQKKDSRFRLVRLDTNSGSGIARNKAIELANGKFIAFLDSDDIWHKDKLSKHVEFMQRNDAVFSHTSYGFLDEGGSQIKQTYRVSAHPIGYSDLLKRTEISCLTAMYDQNFLGKMYMPDLRRKQDYALWLSILKKGVKSIPMDEELAFYRQRKGSATNNKFKLVIKHLIFLNKHEGLNYFQTLYYTTHWLLGGFVKYYLK